MATRNNEKPEAWWETALAAIATAALIVMLFVGAGMIESCSTHTTEESTK